MPKLGSVKRPWWEWVLFLKALVLVWFVRFALWLLPFAWVRNWVLRRKTAPSHFGRLDAEAAYKVIWAVEAAAKRAPKATCLTQALSAQILLGRRGQPTELKLGVRRKAEGGLEAHAWVESEGKVLIGDNGALPHMLPLPFIDGLNK